MEQQQHITITLTIQQFEDIKRLLFDECSRHYYWITMDELSDPIAHKIALRRYKELFNYFVRQYNK